MQNAYEQLLKKLTIQASEKNIPINGAFELTARCNLNCKMCYIHHQKQDCSITNSELSADQWIKIASDARDAGLLNLIITGGEIFLRADFEKIYKAIAGMGLSVTLYTNASLIDCNRAKWLGRISPSKIGITLYGASEETYGKVCGNPEAYKSVIRAIDLLIAEGIIIDLSVTILKDNVNDYERIVEFAAKRNLPLCVTDYLFPIRYNTDTIKKCRLDPRSFADFCRKISPINDQSLKPTRKDLNNRDAFLCNAGKSDFWITWNGHIQPCSSLDEIGAYPLEVGFIEAWHSLSKQCLDVPICHDCRSCEYQKLCDVCPAKMKAETGFYDKPVEYLCEMVNFYRTV
jgi:radical SAM protein with 4Fe4S-binding SPASM domain